jgi:outer membrane immunogenic protein
MKKSLLGGLVLSLTMGGAAMAADMAVKARPYAPAFSWTGCYIGVAGGGAWGRSRHDALTHDGFGGLGEFTPRFDVSGGLVGGTVGCNATIGNSTWVMGAESDLSWTNKKGSSVETGPLGVGIGTTAWLDETKERWISTSRARLGPTWDRLWVYATGGFAAAGVTARVTVPVFGTFEDRQTLYGWTAGAGFEWAWSDFWSIKVEYLYARFENKAFFAVAPAIPAVAGCSPVVAGVPPFCSRGGLNLDDHILRVGLNWRLGGIGKGPVVAAY